MWLATQYGFFSVAWEDRQTYFVRSFLRQDLENLISMTQICFDTEIEERSDAYYPFRVKLSADEFLFAIEWLGKTVNYGSFTHRIDQLPDQRSKAKSYRKLTEAVRKYGTAPDKGEPAEQDIRPRVTPSHDIGVVEIAV